MKYQFRIQGIHCEACVTKIKAALHDIGPSLKVTVNPPLLEFETAESVAIDELNNRLATVGAYKLLPLAKALNSTQEEKAEQSYYPILLILAYIAGVSLLTNLHNWTGMMQTFMAGFFLVFSAFKLIDLKGFAVGYASYDLLAKRWQGYGLTYPFLELGLGIFYLLHMMPTITNSMTIILMGFSSLGVIQALHRKQQIRCACLGTVLNIPLSHITLIEDGLMVLMATIMLIT